MRLFFLAKPPSFCYNDIAMKNKTRFYVSRKSVLTWLMAFCMVCSAVARLVCVDLKGVDTWSQIVLPIAAALLYALICIFKGQERFYQTAIPVWMISLYYYFVFAGVGFDNLFMALYIIAMLFIAIVYTQITSGKERFFWLLLPLLIFPCLARMYLVRGDLLAGNYANVAFLLPDVLMTAGLVFMVFGIRVHPAGEYHPTWGDRPDGRRVRTVPAMSRAVPYIMKRRNGADNTLYEEVEITNLEKYVRDKRKEGLTGFGLNHAFIAAYVRCVSQYPQINRFINGREIFSRGDDIQYCMTIKKEMSVESPDTCIKLHLKPSDTVYDVYEKFEKAVDEVKNAPAEENDFDKTAGVLALLPGPLYAFAVKLLEILDYVGLLPGFLLEVSPFHGSVFFTSMGSLGIPAIIHHLYDFGNLPVFIAFGKKYRRNEVDLDGTVHAKKYVDMGFTLDERICDGFYYAAVLKYLKRLLANPERLDTPPETVVEDIP